MQPVSNVLAKGIGSNMRMVPCRIVTVTPPTVSIEGATVPALFLTGTMYLVDAQALAFIPAAGTPFAVPVIGV